MPITYDISTDGLYLEGIEKGLEEGIERGREQGEAKREIDLISNLLKQGVLTIEQIAEAAGVSADRVLEIKKSAEV